jgi:signal peptidase I
MEYKLTRNKTARKKSLLQEYAEALFIALLIALFIRTFIVQAFKIPSESMLNTLLVGDQLLGNKFAYGIKIPFTHTYVYHGQDPKFQDIVIFEYPNDPDTDFIKRVIGVPGDTIELRQKRLYRNGQPVEEPYVRHTSESNMEPRRDNFGPVTVPPGKLFVMGDNRDNSMDSRYWGFLDRSAIRAKAWRIYWSWASITDIRWSRLGNRVQ